MCVTTETTESQTDGSIETLERYKLATIRKRRNQKKIPTPKIEVGKN